MPITQDGVELGVTISETAAKKIKYFAEKDGIPENVGIRVAVKGGGCSGLTYDLTITGEELPSDKIVEQIIDLIAQEVLKPGERLPSERELCTMFGVGRTSVREALRSLSVMGILDGRVGEGTFVCDNGEEIPA